MKKKLSSIFVSLCLMISMGFQAYAASNYSQWAEEYITAAEEYKIITGSIADSDLTEEITRENFCELAYLTINEISAETKIKITYTQRETSFYDTDNASVAALKRMGIISGKTSTKFDPDAFITREEAASILTRMVDYLGLTEFTNTQGFTDRKNISSWAKESVNVVCGMNIMNGMGDGSFNPKGTYTKEQAVSTMIRLINNVPDEDSREKIDNTKYYVSNEYFRWVEDVNGKVIFKLSASKYSGLNFYSNGEKVVAFAAGENSTDVYDIDNGKKLFTIPAVVAATSSNKYIIVCESEKDGIYGVYDFHGQMVLPIEYSWEDLYAGKYVSSSKKS